MLCNSQNFITRLQKQKEDALEYVIEHYSPFVNAIAYKILSGISVDAVDDCLNDVFLAVWQNASQFKGEPEDFKKWIGMLAKYKAIDIFRKLEKQQSREKNDNLIEQTPKYEDLQELLVKKEEKENLLLAISKLNSIDQDIFMMKYYLQLSNLEIAKALNLSKAAVENRLYRGKKRLAILIQLKERFM
ncbi:sigma-70 family RNA polymerase sigma factor [Metabacillus fastidiosus]|uniref:sigma-70 family RNA polymerase sigma factor n=1 Tax=Metabacillus fastidiosus TaxID=1458 RepID=UPI003D2AAE48